MTAENVLDILKTFNDIRVKVWIAGGWAIDALVGKQTRSHNDLDLAFDAKDEKIIIETFNKLGFSIEDDARPTRFVLRKKDEIEIDMHPVVFDDNGMGRQLVPDGKPFIYPLDAFSEGAIAGVKVPCLSAKQLIEFHKGYIHLEKDKHNMKVLHEYLGKKVLIIGTGGTGKTYTINKLKEMGVNAVDADSVWGLIRWVDENGQVVNFPEDASEIWIKKHHFIWQVHVLEDLLAKPGNLYLFGISETAFDVIDLFDKVYYLKATPELVIERLSHPSRENPMGKTKEQKALLIKSLNKTIEKAEKLGLKSIDASLTPEEIYGLIK